MEAEQYTLDAGLWVGHWWNRQCSRQSARHTRQCDSRDSVWVVWQTNAQFIRPFDLGTPPSSNSGQLSIAPKA